MQGTLGELIAVLHRQVIIQTVSKIVSTEYKSLIYKCYDIQIRVFLCVSETAGHPLLLKEITQLYTSVKPENIMVIAPQEGIYLAMKAIAMHLQK